MSNFLKSVLTFEQGYRMWSFIFLTAIVEIFLVVGTYMNWHLRQIPWLVGFTFLAFLLAFISHLNFTQTPKRIIVLVLYFAFTGFMIDAVLINTEQFHFNIKSIYIFNTPVTQIFGWFFMFYMVFSTSSSVGMMLNGGKSSYSWLGAFLRSLLDGVLFMGYSFLLEPMGVNEGSWQWTIDTPYQYFSVPYMVFFGFFLSIFCLGLPFRLFEAYRPLKKPPMPLQVILFSPIVFILLMILLLLNLLILDLIIVTILGGFLLILFSIIFAISLYFYHITTVVRQDIK